MGKQKILLRSSLEEVAAWPDLEYVRAFQLFLESYHGESIEALLIAENRDLHHSLVVEYAVAILHQTRLSRLPIYHFLGMSISAGHIRPTEINCNATVSGCLSSTQREATIIAYDRLEKNLSNFTERECDHNKSVPLLSTDMSTSLPGRPANSSVITIKRTVTSAIQKRKPKNMTYGENCYL